MYEILTTLCYIERDDKYLMLHRVSKKNDISKDKWLGVGGRFEANESPEECMQREILEETGYNIPKDKLKFRYLTRKQEKQLQKINEIESNGTRAYMLDTEREILAASISTDKLLKESDKKVMRNAISIMGEWSKKLKEVNDSKFNKLVTNSLLLQIMAVNGNTDREFIKKYVNMMPAMDALSLRKYIEKNRPGINFDIEVQRPESLGGGSFKTFLNWDDSVFLNIPDL